MALATRNDLKNAVISWLYARTDVEANFDDFVTMTEEMLNHGAEDMQALQVSRHGQDGRYPGQQRYCGTA